jgi:hypothetical protein
MNFTKMYNSNTRRYYLPFRALGLQHKYPAVKTVTFLEFLARTFSIEQYYYNIVPISLQFFK